VAAGLADLQPTEPGVREQTGRTGTEGVSEAANLFPDTVGLPMMVWILPRGNSRLDVPVRVNMMHGNQMTIAVVGVRPTLA
jgi:hypothetical protein